MGRVAGLKRQHLARSCTQGAAVLRAIAQVSPFEQSRTPFFGADEAFSDTMSPTYEIYLLKPDFRLEGIVGLREEDEAAAIERARNYDHPHWRELWRGGAIVGRYAPPSFHAGERAALHDQGQCGGVGDIES